MEVWETPLQVNIKEYRELWNKSKKTDLAWAAGFYDGEGCTTSRENNRRIRVHVAQATKNGEIPEVLTKFHKIMFNMGTINREYRNRKDRPIWNDLFAWQTSTMEETRLVLCLMWPFLSSEKKDQAIKCLTNSQEYIPEKRLYTNRCSEGHLYDVKARHLRNRSICRICENIKRSQRRLSLQSQ